MSEAEVLISSHVPYFLFFFCNDPEEDSKQENPRNLKPIFDPR